MKKAAAQFLNHAWGKSQLYSFESDSLRYPIMFFFKAVVNEVPIFPSEWLLLLF